jgi:hypothetical protein
LADHGAECADGDVFARMRDDDCVAICIPILGVAAAFGHEFKAVGGEDGDEFGGWDSLRHGARIRSGDGKFSYGDFSDLWDGGGFGEVFEIKFDSLLEVGEGFLFGGTETGDVVIEALCDVVRFFAVEGVMDASHRLKNREKALDGKVEESKGGQDAHIP